MRGFAWGVAIAVLFGTLTGCWSNVTKGYVNPKFPLSKISSVAVMPLSGGDGAELAADMLAMGLTSKNVFDSVLDRTQLQAILAEHNLDQKLLDDKTLLRKGNFITADTRLAGGVSRFVQGVPHYPVATQSEVALPLRLVSAETGQIIRTQLYSKQPFGRGLLAPNPADLIVEMTDRRPGHGRQRLELTADWYDANCHRRILTDNPEGPVHGMEKTVRGGSWSNNATSIRTTNRHGLDPADQNNNAGFRCAQYAP